MYSNLNFCGLTTDDCGAVGRTTAVDGDGALWLSWLLDAPKGPSRVSNGTSEIVNADAPFMMVTRTRRAA